MTIRLNMDSWTHPDRSNTRRIGALTIEPAGDDAYTVVIQDNRGEREEFLVTNWRWETTHPWRLIRHAIGLWEQKRQPGECAKCGRYFSAGLNSDDLCRNCA